MRIKGRYRFFQSKKEIESSFESLGCDLAGIRIMEEKALFLCIEVQNISLRSAIILKQEMMALGGEVVVSRDVMTLQPEKTNAIILGTRKQYKKLVQKLYQQPFGCKEIGELLCQMLENAERKEEKWQWNGKHLDFSKPIVMGILNVTPDSFSDGGKFFAREKAIDHAKNLIEQGANILDIGGESTKPGSDPVSVEKEMSRVLPVIEALKQMNVSIPLSIDTSKPEVAKACLEAGVDMINDVTGMKNQEMRTLAATYDIPIVMMHMQGTPKIMQHNPIYEDVVDDIIDFFEEQLALCKEDGITKIICDPGIGFGKTVEQNLVLLKRLREFSLLNVPIMVGTSRKSFIEKTIGGKVDDRLEGTIASIVVARMHGASLFRVHDVKECKRALDLTVKIMVGEGQ